MTNRQILRIMDQEESWLSAQPGVHGLGIEPNPTTGELSMTIHCLPGTNRQPIEAYIAGRCPLYFIEGDAPQAERL